MFLKCCLHQGSWAGEFVCFFLVAQFKILAETKQRNSLSSSCTLNIEPITLNTGGRSWQTNRGIQDNKLTCLSFPCNICWSYVEVEPNLTLFTTNISINNSPFLIPCQCLSTQQVSLQNAHWAFQIFSHNVNSNLSYGYIANAKLMSDNSIGTNVIDLSWWVFRCLWCFWSNIFNVFCLFVWCS